MIVLDFCRGHVPGLVCIGLVCTRSCDLFMCGSKCHSIIEWYSVPSTMHSKSKNVFNTAWVHLRPCTSMMLQLLFELALATLLWSICLQSIHVFGYTKHPESVGIPAQWMGNFLLNQWNQILHRSGTEQTSVEWIRPRQLTVKCEMHWLSNYWARGLACVWHWLQLFA